MGEKMDKTLARWLAGSALGMSLAFPGTHSDTAVYRTYSRWEPDGILAAWVIHRFVDPEAAFEAVPKGTKIEKGFSINTSRSVLKRTGRETAYEKALRYYHLKGDSCDRIFLPMIRVLELAPWKKTRSPELMTFEEALRHQVAKGGMSAAFSFLQSYCHQKREGK